MAKRRFLGRVPIWVRVSGIVTAIMVGVLLSTTLLAAGGVGDRNGGGSGSPGSSRELPITYKSGAGGDHTGRDHSLTHDSGAGGDHTGGDHSSGDHSSRGGPGSTR
jgi:hypothetical protein